MPSLNEVNFLQYNKIFFLCVHEFWIMLKQNPLETWRPGSLIPSFSSLFFSFGREVKELPPEDSLEYSFEPALREVDFSKVKFCDSVLEPLPFFS